LLRVSLRFRLCSSGCALFRSVRFLLKRAFSKVWSQVFRDKVQQLRDRRFEGGKSLLNRSSRFANPYNSLVLEFLVFVLFELKLVLLDLEFLVFEFFEFDLGVLVR
jgi:hypothetical protein